jgi:hypothetical protein
MIERRQQADIDHLSSDPAELGPHTRTISSCEASARLQERLAAT